MSGRAWPTLLCCAAMLTVPATGEGSQRSQGPQDEQAEYGRWLDRAPNSPRRALALLPIGRGVRLGPAEVDVPLPGTLPSGPARIEERDGVIELEDRAGRRRLPRGRPVSLGRYTLTVAGPPGRAVLTVYGIEPRGAPAVFYPIDSSRVWTAALTPPVRPARLRVLGADGVEVEAAEAGTFPISDGDSIVHLRVLRLPGASSDESELEIYLRDGTSGRGTYPAGRFVALVPVGPNRYRLDFNRARSPFCAHSSAYPCPAPWRGNTLRTPMTAGERYGALPAQRAFRPSVEATGTRSLRGPWRAALDLAGGQLPFSLVVTDSTSAPRARLCNGDLCQPISGVRTHGDSVEFEIGDYAATIAASWQGDSLAGTYRNVGNRGPRVIPFHARRGRWPATRAPAALLGRWDANFFSDWGTTPRVFEFRNGQAGLEGTVISNSGDYGHFSGTVSRDSFALGHFDGSFVYLLTGRIAGDTLRGIFHAGARTQTPWQAVRSRGTAHLTPPDAVTRADTTHPFRFSFPDLHGRIVTERDPRFAGKVMLVDVFGTWCPTCHDAAPVLARLDRKYRSRGLRIVGLAYEVTGDTAVDGRQVRRYARKYGLEFPLLLAGTNDTEAAAASLPQLDGLSAFPTMIFLGRDGRVRRVHAGFYGPATGAQYRRLIREFETEVERLLRESERG